MFVQLKLCTVAVPGLAAYIWVVGGSVDNCRCGRSNQVCEFGWGRVNRGGFGMVG